MITVGNSKIDYDELIIGLGCEDKYHNVPGAEAYTHSIQTLSKSRETYHRISELPKGARVGIVGAGLSGIELASDYVKVDQTWKFCYMIEGLEF